MAQFGRRPRLYLRKSFNDEPNLATFSQCLLDYFTPNISQTHVQVDHTLEDNRLILTQVDETVPNAHLLVHPDTCPIHHLSSDERQILNTNEKLSDVGIAASAIVESSDEHVLLTRRAKTLRSFPMVWVGPGGYTEPDELTLTTVLRETHEETGLELSKMEHEINVLNLWESAFPDRNDKNAAILPKRHDIVLYYHIKLLSAAKSLRKFCISPDEVDMICWLPKNCIHSVAHATLDNDQVDCKIDVLAYANDQSKLIETTVPLSDFVSDNNVSKGTRYAMRRLLEKKKESEISEQFL